MISHILIKEHFQESPSWAHLTRFYRFDQQIDNTIDSGKWWKFYEIREKRQTLDYMSQASAVWLISIVSVLLKFYRWFKFYQGGWIAIKWFSVSVRKIYVFMCVTNQASLTGFLICASILILLRSICYLFSLRTRSRSVSIQVTRSEIVSSCVHIYRFMRQHPDGCHLLYELEWVALCIPAFALNRINWCWNERYASDSENTNGANSLWIYLVASPFHLHDPESQH